MRASWTRPLLAACVCWAATAGCYVSREVAPAALQNAGAGLKSGVAIAAADGEAVALRPSTNVRVWTRGGGASDWHDASDLILVPNGVATDSPHDLDDTVEGFVADLTPAQLARLRALTPPGAVVEEGERRVPIFIGFQEATVVAAYQTLLSNPRWVRLTCPARGVLASWARRFVAEATTGGPLGIWLFLDPRHRRLAPPLHGAALAGWPPGERLYVAAGASWPEVRAVELRSIDPLPTLAAAVPLLPLAILAAVAVSAMGGEVHSSTSSPDLPGGGADHAVVVSTPCARPCAPPAMRLFDEGARRRGYVRGLVLAGGAVDTHAAALGEIAAGIRLYDITEIALVLRGRSVGDTGARSFESSAGLAMGLHSPFSEGSPWAVAFGLAAGGTLVAPHLLWIDARLGLRRELAGGVFVALPFIASFHEAAPMTGRGPWSLGLAFDVGLTF